MHIYKMRRIGIAPLARLIAPVLGVTLSLAARPIAAETARLLTPETALDRYVHAPDAHFHYELVKTVSGAGYTAYVLDMTSQQYLAAAEVDHPVWKHWLVIAKPNKVTSKTGLLFIDGGSIGRPAPENADARLAAVAVDTGAVVAELRDVPNEPLIFAGETRERTEDAIIAYTWAKYLHTADEKWPLRLPMTKAAVRAMDATTAFMASPAGGGVAVEHYVVAGASKRGWTTWTTAAVDGRVVAIIPMVIDMLNIVPSFLHEYRAYGGYSDQVKDYEEAGIMSWMGTEEYRKLMKIEEPFEYRQRLTMPKFIINASGDQYFVPDSSQFYFDQLPGEKYLRYVPNANHDVTAHTDAGETIEACFTSIVKGTPRPEFTWKLEDRRIVVDTKTEPIAVKLWQATNPEARDFRLEKIGPAFHASDLKAAGPGHYVADLAKPAKGFTAYFIELTYPSGGKYPFKFTTGVKVEPDVLPYPTPKVVAPEGSHPVGAQH
jgi:PhoPQ-activated pathogenicity-related protein